MSVFKDTALKALKDFAQKCPIEGDVSPELAFQMLSAATAAMNLGASSDEVREAMYQGYLSADIETLP